MSIKKFLTLPRRGAGYCTTLVALAILAAPGLAWAQDCNVEQTVLKNPNGPYQLGDTTRVRYEFGAGTVTTPDQLMTIPDGTLRFALDCIDAENDTDRQTCLGFPGNIDGTAEDDGDAILYQGGLTWGSVQGTVCDGVTFTATSSSTYPPNPPANPNLLVFSTGSDLTFEGAAGTEEYCYIEFDVLVNSLGDTPTENIVRGGAGFTSRCSLGLGADNTQSTAYVIDLQPELQIVKEVSLDDGANWFDANDPDTPYPIGIVGLTLAQYRITVTNIGEETLANPTVTDAILPLGPITLPAGCLPFEVDDVCVITSGDTGFGILGDYGVCQSPGVFRNLACANGTGALSGAAAPQVCDEANVDCRMPAIDIIKRVRDPATGIWEDANSAPGVSYPTGAVVRYQLEVCNTGDIALDDVWVEDFDLNIPNTNIGPLTVGQCVLLEEGDLTGLDSSLACANPGPFLNIAYADGYYGGGLGPVEDDDPANVFCRDPSLDVTKTGPPEVKYGDTYDNYRICAINDGDTDLQNCLGTDDRIGDLGQFGTILAPTDEVCKTFSYTVPLDETADPVVNTATIICDVVGTASDTVTDSDTHSAPVFVIEGNMVKTCTPDSVPVGTDICWDITINNTGDKPFDCVVNDVTAGITNADLAVPAGGSNSLAQVCRTVLGDEAGSTISNTATAVCAASGYTNAIDVCTDPAGCQADCVVPGDELCRTPGFWKTHAGEEKAGRSSNLTQIVIDSTLGNTLGPICGVEITDTWTNNYPEGTGYDGGTNGANSAVEGMCVHPKQQIIRQLQRQLIAASLNCVVSGGSADCTGISIEADWKAANADCAANTGNLSGWVDIIDDFNNGVDGVCSPNIKESDVFDGIIAAGKKVPGPAGSSNACSEATYNDFYLVP